MKIVIWGSVPSRKPTLMAQTIREEAEKNWEKCFLRERNVVYASEATDGADNKEGITRGL
jgi:hypothetical protein